MIKHLRYVLSSAESQAWNSGNKKVMGYILKSATSDVQVRGVSRFSLFDADENLLLRIPLSDTAWINRAR